MSEFCVLKSTAFLPQQVTFDPNEEAASSEQLFVRGLAACGIAVDEYAKVQILYAFRQFFIQPDGDQNALKWRLERVCGRPIDISDLVLGKTQPPSRTTVLRPGETIVPMRTLLAMSGRRPKVIGSGRHARNKKM